MSNDIHAENGWLPYPETKPEDEVGCYLVALNNNIYGDDILLQEATWQFDQFVGLHNWLAGDVFAYIEFRYVFPYQFSKQWNNEPESENDFLKGWEYND